MNLGILRIHRVKSISTWKCAREMFFTVYFCTKLPKVVYSCTKAHIIIAENIVNHSARQTTPAMMHDGYNNRDNHVRWHIQYFPHAFISINCLIITQTSHTSGNIMAHCFGQWSPNGTFHLHSLWQLAERAPVQCYPSALWTDIVVCNEIGTAWIYLTWDSMFSHELLTMVCMWWLPCPSEYYIRVWYHT